MTRSLLLLACAWLMTACASLAPADPTPMLGQSGKDAVWITTPDELARRMLQLAQIGPEDRLVDLGSGDGRIVIQAARDFGAQGLGIEYDAALVRLAREAAQEAGVASRTQFVQGDIFKSDFSDATVVAIYLWPHLNLRLRHQLLAMPPGTRIVTHQFDMGDWPPDEVSAVMRRRSFLWVVPANMSGTWLLHFPHGGRDLSVSMTLAQTFQTFGGTVALPPGFNTTLRDTQLLGREVAFSFTDSLGERRRFTGRIEGDRLSGTVTGARGEQPFEAERIGPAPPIKGSEPVAQEVIDKSRVDF